MIALFSLLTIVILSITVVRIGAIALELTGLSPEIASFQAMSAFSGTGFTTTEAESLVTHPVRRRIIRILILLGNAGITTTIATFILTFIGETGMGALVRGSILAGGILVIFFMARSKHIYNLMKVIISRALARWTTMRIMDYEELLGFGAGYSISRIGVKPDSWMRDRTLGELKLEQKGILILAIYRRIGSKENFIGGLTGDTVIKSGDVLICYAHKSVEDVVCKKEESCQAA